MSRKAEAKSDVMSKSDRLALIKKRHRALIVGPRELISSALDLGVDDSFEDADEELHLAGIAGVASL